MKIKTFYLNSTKEIIVKIVKEILVLFKVEINDADDTIFDYDELKIENIYDDVALNGVKTVLTLRKDEKLWTYTRQSFLHDDESIKAGTNRLIKLNLYHIFCEDLQAKKAPWGILHGVRPTKIVHRLMKQGLDRQGVIGRLQGDYEVQIDKANLITDIAYLQLPFLAKANDPKLISVYVGIPFCPSRCLYCSFPSSILPSSEMTRKYLQTLNYEITKIKALIEQYDFKVQSIYVGGGTPTSLNENDFDDLLSLVAKSFKGDYVEEFTVEAGRPDSLSLEKAKSIVKYGADRVSVNPQTMQDRTLSLIGRKHTSADILRAFKQVRQAGIKHVNTDLIIGLPGEDIKDAQDTINKVIDLAPDDITLHALALKKGSELKLIRDNIVLPDDETVQAMAKIMTTAIDEYGLIPYYIYRQGYMSGQLENVGYSKKGQEGIYNIQIMGERQTILGVGGAATSKITYPGKRLQTSFNAKDLYTYLNSIDKYIERRAMLLKEAYGD